MLKGTYKMTSVSTPICDIMHNANSVVGKLIKKASQLEALNQQFQQIVQHNRQYTFSTGCRVGCYELGVLTLFADNGALATKVRYSIPDILSQLRSKPEWAGIRSIQVKIDIRQQETVLHAHKINPFPTPMPPSEKNANHLLSIANQLASNKEEDAMQLAKSLERLAQLSKKITLI